MQSKQELGVLIQLNRMYLGLSQAELAKQLHISTSHLSKIEHGTQIFNNQNYLEILNFLGIDLCKLETCLRQHEQWMTDIWQNIIAASHKEKVLAWAKALSNQPFISVSALLGILMAKTTYMSHEQQAIRELIKILEKNILQVNKKQQSLFFLYQGIYFSNQKCLDKALNIFLKAAKLTDDTVLLGMIHFYLGKLYRKMNFTIDSYRALMTAKDYFFKAHLYPRCLLTDLTIANTYFVNAEYEKATLIYFDFINQVKSFYISHEFIAPAYLNIIRIYTFLEEYKKAKAFIHQIPDDILCYLQSEQALYFDLYQIMILNGLKDDQGAKQLAQKYWIAKPCQNFDHNLIMYYYYIKHKKKRLSYLNKNKALAIKGHDYSACRLLLRLLHKEASTPKEKEDLLDFYHLYTSHQL